MPDDRRRDDPDDVIPAHMRRLPGPMPEDMAILLGRLVEKIDGVREDVSEIKQDVKGLTAAQTWDRSQIEGLTAQGKFHAGRIGEMYTAVTVSKGLVWILKFGSILAGAVAGLWAGISWIVRHWPAHGTP